MELGCFNFRGCRKIYGKKNIIGFFESLILNNPCDLLIQKSIHIILEEIFERKLNFFNKHSHGFRPNRS